MGLLPAWMCRKPKIKKVVDVTHLIQQTKVTSCITKDCANRKQFECNLKGIEMRDGKCLSLIEETRDDLRVVKPDIVQEIIKDAAAACKDVGLKGDGKKRAGVKLDNVN